jgi:hypothetical protein
MLRIQEALCQDKKILPSKPLLIIIAVNIGMRKHNVFRFARKRWYKPAEKNSRGESAEELRYYKARTSAGRIPAKVSVNARASATAGLRPLRVCLLEQRR